MDIPALASAMSATKVAQQVNVSMMKKAKEQMEQTGEQMAEMIQATEVPSDAKIDVKL